MKKLKIFSIVLFAATLAFFAIAMFSIVRVRIEDAKYGYKGDGYYADPKVTAYSYLDLELSVLDWASRISLIFTGLWIIWGILWYRAKRKKASISPFF